MKHFNISGFTAVHPFAFVQETDPALDSENQVAANKAWFKTSTQQLFVRNAGNTGWFEVGVPS